MNPGRRGPAGGPPRVSPPGRLSGRQSVEATTITPLVETFQAAGRIAELVIVVDTEMLSAAKLAALDDARMQFIIEVRQVRAPGDLAAHFQWVGRHLS